jgi:cell division protein FtsB
MAKINRPVSEPTNIADKKIVFSVQQIITYSVTFLTIGASIYTFFKALPKIDALDASLQQLKESNARVDQRISDLKEYISIQKELKESNRQNK